MIELIERLFGIRRVTVQENQRIVALNKGRFMGILGPGEHRVKAREVRMDVHDLNEPVFTSALDRALFREQPAMAAEHFTEVVTGSDEVRSSPARVARGSSSHRASGWSCGPPRARGRWSASTSLPRWT